MIVVTAANLVWLGKVSVYKSCNLVSTAQAMLSGLYPNAECPTLFRSLWIIIIHSGCPGTLNSHSSFVWGIPHLVWASTRSLLGVRVQAHDPSSPVRPICETSMCKEDADIVQNLLWWRGQRYLAYKGSNCRGPNGNDVCLAPCLWAVVSSQMEDTGFFRRTALWYDSEPFLIGWSPSLILWSSWKLWASLCIWIHCSFT